MANGITIYKALTATDIFTDTTKTTAGIFSGDAGSLTGDKFYTSSISASNKSYYWTITDGEGTGSNKLFDISFGHYYASGSDLSAGYNSSNRETEAVYKQFANILLDDPIAKFTFSDVSGSDTGTEDDVIYVLSTKTAKMKDRVDQRFTIVLSGSLNNGSSSVLSLTNYTNSKYPSIAGDYYKVISGSAGDPAVDADLIDAGGYYDTGDLVTYGHFWPNLGTIVFSGTQLSGSIPGVHAESGSVGVTDSDIGVSGGFAPDVRTDGTAINHKKLWHGLESGSVVMRSEQDLNQTTYYCRMYHSEYNHSSNPTFIVSGSTLGDILPSMIGDPHVYVTGVGLYNGFGNLLAVAKLNVPQKKNYNTELTVAAKLDG